MSLSDEKIKQLDFGRLRIFSMVYQTRSFSEAARRLKITQPGVSRAIARLREQLEDQLFISGINGLEPTSRAQVIGLNIERLLIEVSDCCFPPSSFDPKTYTGEIRLAVSSLMMDSLGTKITEMLLQKAPLSKVHLYHWSRLTVTDISEDRIDIGINHIPLETTKTVRQRTTGIDPIVVVMRHDHPLRQQTFSPEAVFQYPLVGMIITSVTDYQGFAEMASYKNPPHFVLRSEHTQSLLAAIENSDRLLMATRATSGSLPKGFYVYQPDGIDNNLSIALFTHQRYDQHPKHLWLREEIEKMVKAV